MSQHAPTHGEPPGLAPGAPPADDPSDWKFLAKNLRDPAIVMLDPRGRVTGWNAGAEAILGYTRAEALGLHLAAFFTLEAGTLVTVLGVNNDVTELRQIREADRRKDEFLAMLGHELRNPLAPILTSLQVMREALPEACRSGEAGAGRLTHLHQGSLRALRSRSDFATEREIESRKQWEVMPAGFSAGNSVTMPGPIRRHLHLCS